MSFPVIRSLSQPSIKFFTCAQKEIPPLFCEEKTKLFKAFLTKYKIFRHSWHRILFLGKIINSRCENVLAFQILMNLLPACPDGRDFCRDFESLIKTFGQKSVPTLIISDGNQRFGLIYKLI